MTLRFQADADLNYKIVAGIRRRERAIEFFSAAESNLLGLVDDDVLRIAAGSGRVLVSHDRNTMLACSLRLIRDHSSPGLILVNQGMEIGAAIEELILI